MNNSEITDYRVKVRVYNNRLKQRREALGLSLKKLAETIGTSGGGEIGSLETMVASPLRKYSDGTSVWRDVVVKLATFFCCEPEDLFPDHALVGKVTSLDYFVNQDQLDALIERATDPAMALEAAEQRQLLKENLPKAIGTLPEREQKVLRLRFGLDGSDPMTLEKVRETLGITSKEMVRQIECRALSRLRYPTLNRYFKHFKEE